MKKVLAIFGAGGLGREVLELAKIINIKNKRWDGYIFVVNEIKEKCVHDVEVCTYEEMKKMIDVDIQATVAIGEPIIRKKVFEELEADKVKLVTLIHPSVHIPKSTSIGRGVTIQMGCFISCDVKIEDGVFISENSSIGHDVKLCKGVIILPICAIAGSVCLGEYSIVCMHTCIKQGIRIGEFCIVSMGAVVVYDVSDFAFVVGNPARVSCKNSKQRIF